MKDSWCFKVSSSLMTNIQWLLHPLEVNKQHKKIERWLQASVITNKIFFKLKIFYYSVYIHSLYASSFPTLDRLCCAADFSRRSINKTVFIEGIRKSNYRHNSVFCIVNTNIFNHYNGNSVVNLCFFGFKSNEQNIISICLFRTI